MYVECAECGKTSPDLVWKENVKHREIDQSFAAIDKAEFENVAGYLKNFIPYATLGNLFRNGGK